MVYYICPQNKPALIDIKQSSYIGFIFIIINIIIIIIIINPLTPMSDQDRISPHNINTKNNQISDENKEKYQFGDNKLIQY